MENLLEEPSWRERVELERRLVHASGAVLVAPYLLGWLTWGQTGLLLAVGVVAVVALEYLRIVVGLDHLIYRKLTRPYEADSPAGYALYMVSMAGVALLFEPAVAIPGMLMLALADPVSGALGDNDADEPKRPAVLVVTFLVCLALALPFTVPAAGAGAGTIAAIVGAAGATVADGVPAVIRGRPVDDNLTIPPAAAVGIFAVFLVAGV